MLNFIQANYKTVSLADMAAQFNLTEPYISKYIKEKSGKTFGELVTNAKMKKARTLLRKMCIRDSDIAVLDDEKHIGNVERILPRKNELIRPAVSNIDTVSYTHLDVYKRQVYSSKQRGGHTYINDQ